MQIIKVSMSKLQSFGRCSFLIIKTANDMCAITAMCNCKRSVADCEEAISEKTIW